MLLQEDIDDFIAAAKRGDIVTLASIIGWDTKSADKEATEMLQCLLNRNAEKSMRIAESMTNRVAELYATELYNKRFKERDNDE